MASIPVDAEVRFSGYASVFGRLDDGGDIVMSGAFANSLRQRGTPNVRMLFQHDPKDPVGIWTTLVEDGVGLWAEGQLTGGVPRADALRKLIAAGALDGLSIGFRTVKAKREAGTGRRKLIEIDLWEISIVTFPMLEGARIATHGTTPGAEARLLRSLDAAITALKHP